MDLLLVSLSYGAQVICVFAGTGETKQAATISRQIQIALNMSTSKFSFKFVKPMSNSIWQIVLGLEYF